MPSFDPRPRARSMRGGFHGSPGRLHGAAAVRSGIAAPFRSVARFRDTVAGRRGQIAIRRVLEVLFALTFLSASGLLFAAGAAERTARTTVDEPSEPSSAFSVVDSAGRTVSFPAVPVRIVTAGRSVFMTANAMYLFSGAPSRIVGVGRINQGYGDFLRIVDGAYGEKAILENNIGPEQIAALSPDAVVLKNSMYERLGKPLEALGLPVVTLDLETPERFSADLRTLGAVFGEEDRAEELVSYYERESASIAAAVRGVPERDRPRVLFLYASSDDGVLSFSVPPADWIQTTIVELAGGVPVWKDAASGGGWTRIGFEQISAWNPDVVLLATYHDDLSEVKRAIFDDPLWARTAAVGNGRVHSFPGDYYSWDQPDARWILGLRWTAARLHPDLAAEPSWPDLLREFFSFTYRLPSGTVDRHIIPKLQGDVR